MTVVTSTMCALRFKLFCGFPLSHRVFLFTFFIKSLLILTLCDFSSQENAKLNNYYYTELCNPK